MAPEATYSQNSNGLAGSNALSSIVYIYRSAPLSHQCGASTKIEIYSLISSKDFSTTICNSMCTIVAHT